MIQKSLPDILMTMVSAVGDHLWQSTMFVVACGLLSVFLRRSHAHVRHGLWLAASVKFLIPFSLLVNVGSRWASTPSSPSQSRVGIYSAIDEVSRPFTHYRTGEFADRRVRDLCASHPSMAFSPGNSLALRICCSAAYLVRALGAHLGQQAGCCPIRSWPRSGGTAPDGTHRENQ